MVPSYLNDIYTQGANFSVNLKYSSGIDGTTRR